MTDAALVQPLFRGYLHLFAAALAPAGLVALLQRADSPRGFVSAAICGAAILLLFSVSAAYHLCNPRRRLRTFMRRADHSTIFVAIAGIYTPFCLLSLGNGWGISLLAVVWSLAGLGIVVRMAGWLPPRAVSIPYLVVGWSALVGAPEIASNVGPGIFAAIVVSGLVYSAGGVIFALQRPDPFPRVFGYHEVFHTLVLVATLSMYLVIFNGIIPV